MAEIASTRSSEISRSQTENINELADRSVFVRVSTNSYFIAGFIATFFSGLFLYLEYDIVAAALFACGWILMPIALWSDKIVFDGKRLVRTGVIPRIWASINGSGNSLSLDEVEQVETQALRALKRGGSVFYRYRTTVSGEGRRLVLASGGESYRRMVRSVLPMLSESLLDNRSI